MANDACSLCHFTKAENRELRTIKLYCLFQRRYKRNYAQSTVVIALKGMDIEKGKRSKDRGDVARKGSGDKKGGFVVRKGSSEMTFLKIKSNS